MTRIDIIRKALKKHGPMSALDISKKTGISEFEVRRCINWSRKASGKKMGIRVAGSTREGQTKWHRVFELSNLPDSNSEYARPDQESTGRVFGSRVSSDEAIEERMRRHVHELAAAIRPFRDPMLFFTCGRAP